MHLGSLESTKEAEELLEAIAESNSSFLSAVSKLPKCIHNSIYALLKA